MILFEVWIGEGLPWWSGFVWEPAPQRRGLPVSHATAVPTPRTRRSPTAEAFAPSDADKEWWPRPGTGPPGAPAAYRPQTSDKIERFRCALTEGWALKKSYGRQKPAASQPCPVGSTSTITTGPTPRSQKPHPSPGRGLFTGGVSPVKVLVGGHGRMNMNKFA